MAVPASSFCRVLVVATKLSQLRSLMAADQWSDALAVAARFPRLGAHAVAITRAHNARLRPCFYQELGQDPAALVAAGVAALRDRYGDPS